jgi:hypothetical protein
VPTSLTRREEMAKRHADKYIFWVCLVASIVIGIVSFILPPTGVIDPSCLKFIALLLGFSALGVAGQNLANGKDVIFSHGDTKVEINDEEDK